MAVNDVVNQNKSKIVLYGVLNRKLRYAVRRYLCDRYEIIGITDGKVEKDYLQNDRFYNIRELSREVDFDYILILSTKEDSQNAMILNLISQGVDRNKIVVPRLLFNDDFLYVPDLIQENDHINGDEDTLLTGLSYTMRGISCKELSSKAWDISWHGLDLYYNYLSILHCDISRVQTIVFIMPYYYFNYDMSYSAFQFESGQILACRNFNDWHNAEKCNNTLIRDYLISIRLFGQRFWEYNNWRKEYPFDDTGIISAKEPLENIWKTRNDETEKENLILFSKLLDYIREKRVFIVSPPFYRDGVNEHELNYVEQFKQKFTQIIQYYKMSYDFEFIDYTDLFVDRQYFFDHHHLNQNGRKEFTKVIDRLLSGQ